MRQNILIDVILRLLQEKIKPLLSEELLNWQIAFLKRKLGLHFLVAAHASVNSLLSCYNMKKNLDV